MDRLTLGKGFFFLNTFLLLINIPPVLHILLSLGTGTIGPFEAAVQIYSAPHPIHNQSLVAARGAIILSRPVDNYRSSNYPGWGKFNYFFGK